MKRLSVVCVALFLVMGPASDALAQITFDLDFGQNGTYERSWPLMAGDVVSVDIYVSGVPAPGLMSMGFVMEYDSSKLGVLSASVDASDWPVGTQADVSIAGSIDMLGGRLIAIDGDDIKLGTVTFECTASGESELWLFDRVILMPGFDPDCFVLADETVLDDDIAGGILLAGIEPGFACVKDADGDGDVDGTDLALFAQDPGDLETFALEFGRIDCF